MASNKKQMQKKNASRIIGIQFSILSPEEIRKGSVAEITSREAYVGNKPVINGLFDPRMGVLEPGLICPTDGLDYMQTPGYFGHIELARPLFYIQYLNTIIKIARCICVKCSKLLISKQKFKHLLKLSAEERWDVVFMNASKIRRCGEDTDDGCGCKQPSKIKKEGLATLIAEWDNELAVIDFKSSTREKSEDKIQNYFMQCTAYALMFEEITGKTINQIVVAIATEEDVPQIFIRDKSNYINGLNTYIQNYWDKR